MHGLDSTRIAMLTAGSGLVVGSVDDDGTPTAVRAWSAAITGPGRLRVGVSSDDPELTDDYVGRWVAVTAADVVSLTSVQMKGAIIKVEPPDGADLTLVTSQSEAFFAAIHETDGDSIDVLRRLLPERIAMIEIDVEQVFDQSPGPGAGAQIDGPT